MKRVSLIRKIKHCGGRGVSGLIEFVEAVKESNLIKPKMQHLLRSIIPPIVNSIFITSHMCIKMLGFSHGSQQIRCIIILKSDKYQPTSGTDNR